MKKLSVTCLMLSGVLLAACSSTQKDWTQATGQNTAAGYESFLSKHPDSDHAGEARNRLHALQDEQAWTQAQSTGTLAAYQVYLQQWSNGVHAREAQDKVTEEERKSAWSTAQAADNAAAYQAFLQKYSQGTEADQARAKLATLTGYSVKLAAVRSDKEAAKVRDRLKGKYGNVLHDVVVVPPSGSEKLNYVRSAPMSEDEAKSACATLKKSHQSCEVVKTQSS